MPWRKRPTIENELAKLQKGEELSEVDLFRIFDDIVDRVWRGIRVVLFLCVMMFVVLVGTVVLTARVSGRVDKSQTSTQDAKQAAQDAKAAVENAIKLSQSGQRVDPQAIVNALESIHRVELFLCGGECPSQ